MKDFKDTEEHSAFQNMKIFTLRFWLPESGSTEPTESESGPASPMCTAKNFDHYNLEILYRSRFAT
jgi:hypothetical protein